MKIEFKNFVKDLKNFRFEMDTCTCGSKKTLRVRVDLEEQTLEGMFCKSPICHAAKALFQKHMDKYTSDHNEVIKQRYKQKILNLVEENQALRKESANKYAEGFKAGEYKRSQEMLEHLETFVKEQAPAKKLKSVE